MIQKFFTSSKHFLNICLLSLIGISVEELDVARQAAQEIALADAVAASELTEDEAALTQARQALRDYIQKDELLAKALGIRVEELETAKENGQRISDLLNELGIDQEDFETNMQAAREEALQLAVEDGVITQGQADQILEEGFPGRGGRSRHGGKEGCGGRGGRGGKDESKPQYSVEPTNGG